MRESVEERVKNLCPKFDVYRFHKDPADDDFVFVYSDKSAWLMDSSRAHEALDRLENQYASAVGGHYNVYHGGFEPCDPVLIEPEVIEYELEAALEPFQPDAMAIRALLLTKASPQGLQGPLFGHGDHFEALLEALIDYTG